MTTPTKDSTKNPYVGTQHALGWDLEVQRLQEEERQRLAARGRKAEQEALKKINSWNSRRPSSKRVVNVRKPFEWDTIHFVLFGIAFAAVALTCILVWSVPVGVALFLALVVGFFIGRFYQVILVLLILCAVFAAAHYWHVYWYPPREPW